MVSQFTAVSAFVVTASQNTKHQTVLQAPSRVVEVKGGDEIGLILEVGVTRCRSHVITLHSNHWGGLGLASVGLQQDRQWLSQVYEVYMISLKQSMEVEKNLDNDPWKSGKTMFLYKQVVFHFHD